MNQIAKDLNSKIEDTLLFSVLSEKGKRFYFPKGIISQSQEASKLATNINATIGSGVDKGKPMIFPFVKSLVNELENKEIVSYAPTSGLEGLRSSWAMDMIKKNPSLEGQCISTPIVTSGLTHTINVSAQMFVDKNDNVIYPDFFWGNYNLIFSETLDANIKNFELFNDENSFNIQGLKDLLATYKDNEKVVLVLNFPNNPTGYSLSNKEANDVVKLLSKESNRLRLVIISDDAYFGLFYEDDTCKESIFSLLVKENANYILVKGDALTKEYLAWGFRVGFITYWVKDKQEESYEVLRQKTMGIIRSQLSSCCVLTQAIGTRLLNDENTEKEKENVFNLMKERYLEVKRVLKNFENEKVLQPLSYNSGYFLTFKSQVDANLLREKLLKERKVGIISIKDKYIRLAFSSVDKKDIERLITIVYQEAKSCI